MVDFQSRDTRRDHDDDGPEDAEPEDSPAGDGADRTDDHDHHADDLDGLGVAVVTVSSSRTLDDDPGGDAVAAVLEAEEHEIVARELVADDHDRVQRTVDRATGRGDVDAVVTTGGTGVTPDDVTVEAVEPLLEKELPGFGELFRLLSYEEVGTRMVGTRALAGVTDGVPVFCLPGSENAARLGTEKIIAPEAEHLAGLAGWE